jgi:hypothetical protein
MALSRKEQDIQLLLAAGCHLGTKNLDHRMQRYVHKRRWVCGRGRTPSGHRLAGGTLGTKVKEEGDVGRPRTLTVVTSK